MTMLTYLLKPGELVLKGQNRFEFENRLRKNIQNRLKGFGCSIQIQRGRFYLTIPAENRDQAEEVLRNTIGLAGWALAQHCAKEYQAIANLALEIARKSIENGTKSFKIESRRADKSFPMQSIELDKSLGAQILKDIPSLRVDIHQPDLVIRVEVRDKVWVYGQAEKGYRGLPVGSSGKGILMLSGGIDSPVAGFLMAKRGMRMDAVYFHAWPYTSDEAKEKVIALARLLARWDIGLKLHIVSFTEIQLLIKERVPEAWTTLVMRMLMVELANKLAYRNKAKAVISGESLGQVASQTIENMSCTEMVSRLPLLRPLVGLDKEEIIAISKQIGSYETSILPYEDCCVLFSPKHPIIHANLVEARGIRESLDVDALLKKALIEREIIKFT